VYCASPLARAKRCVRVSAGVRQTQVALVGLQWARGGMTNSAMRPRVQNSSTGQVSRAALHSRGSPDDLVDHFSRADPGQFARASKSVITYLLAGTSRCRASSGYLAPPLVCVVTAGDPTSSVDARDRERWLTLPHSTICRAHRRVSFPAPRLGRGGMAARAWHDFLHGRFSWPPSLRGEQASRDGARRMRGGCGGALAATSSR
jgi:hypothetical protein